MALLFGNPFMTLLRHILRCGRIAAIEDYHA